MTKLQELAMITATQIGKYLADEKHDTVALPITHAHDRIREIVLRCGCNPAYEHGYTAATPELREALKDLLCYASPGGLHGEEPAEWSEQAKRICGAARTAIAKAEGRE
jgi:hypothetical protein